MFVNRVIPCLLLQKDYLVKTISFKNPKYIGDPINTVKIFNEKEVDEIIVLDISATLEKRKPNFPIISDIASECFMPFGYGGGIKSLDDMHKIFHLGAEKVIINSLVFENRQLIREAVKIFGSQSIIISMDIKKNLSGKYQVYIHSGKKNTGLDLVEYLKIIQDLGAGEIFINSIDRDGTGEGYDIKLIKKVADSVNIPVIACGGAGKLDDFGEAIKTAGASAVAAGSMFVFHGKYRAVLITYPSIDEIKSTIGYSDVSLIQ